MEWRFLLWFFGLGMLSVVVIRTSFNPHAEYWRSLEPAHNLVFGYGKLTWEWTRGIRSYAYPCIIAVVYKILAILHLDYVEAVIYAPRILQAMISAIGYYHTCELANIISRKDVMYWTAAALSTNWFIFFCMSRTLYDGVETVLMIIAMKYCTWFVAGVGDQIRVLTFGFIAFIIQPSSAIIFLSIILLQYQIKYKHHRGRGQAAIRWRYENSILREWTIVLISLIVIDCFCYGTFLITPWEFLKINIELDINDQYSFNTAPFVWYFIGLPTVLCSHLVALLFLFFFFSFFARLGEDNDVFIAITKTSSVAILCQCIFIMFCYSCFALKDIRFLLPVISLSCIVIGIYLKKMENAHKRRKRDHWHPNWVIGFLFITNLLFAICCDYHRDGQGTLNAMRFLAEDKTPDNLMNVTFLMPCYVTPAYSHLHRNVSLQFLSCKPNLHHCPDYMDETYTFYQDPNKWILEHELNASTHIVIFDSLKDEIKDFLQSFKLCARIFHTSYHPFRKYVEIYCK